MPAKLNLEITPTTAYAVANGRNPAKLFPSLAEAEKFARLSRLKALLLEKCIITTDVPAEYLEKVLSIREELNIIADAVVKINPPA